MGAVALIVGSIAWWLSGGRYVTTEDAYVQANVLNVTTDVSGLVDRIVVHEGEAVQQGEVLFTLDPTQFQIAIDHAQADLAQVTLQLKSLQADYLTAERQVIAQQAQVDADQATYQRYAQLVTHDAVTRQQYDDARYKLASDLARLGAKQAAATSALARLGGKVDTPLDDLPAYKQAAAQLADAQRNYRHSVVHAAFAGMVTQVSKLQPGQFLAAGTPAFGLVDTRDMWVAAEPKETTLTYARAGDPATVTVDAYPGHEWHGMLQSEAPATDQEFAVLPAQNSSGNWVKVVQRVPVRVGIKTAPSDPPLSAGMSAEVSIDTSHKRSLSDLF
jgi:membrane fusion protein (multidrug efflux system)